MFDVVIAGAGVAGSATAIHLARRGRKVLLVDRSAFPRRKACGEGLFPAGVHELGDLGVLDRLEPATVLEGLRFEGYGLSARAALSDRGGQALGIRRDLLDAALIEQAKRAGAAVRLATQASALVPDGKSRFSLLVERERIEPGAIVAADGLHSALRRQAGLGPARRGQRFGVTAHIELRRPPTPDVEVFFREGFEVYVTPVGGCIVNVAVLLSRPLTRQLAGAPERFVEQVLSHEHCLPDGWRLLDAALVAGPFPVRPRRIYERNLVLAGDAAGFFDGITGEGMSLALVSARHCAEAVDEFLSTGSARPLRRYERLRRSLARNSEILGRLTLALASREWTARAALRGLARRPETFAKLVAVSSGEARLGSLRPWDVLGLLLS